MSHPDAFTNRSVSLTSRQCVRKPRGMGGSTMKIVVIGGTGLIGSKTVAILRQGRHEVVAASPQSGINTITGEGLKEAMAGAQVVIDLANSPSFEDRAVLDFFETSGRNLLAAEAAAGVQHHVALSIVGTDRTPDNGYFRAKVAQEKLIKAAGILCVPKTKFGRTGDGVRRGSGVIASHLLAEPGDVQVRPYQGTDEFGLRYSSSRRRAADGADAPRQRR